MEITFQHYEVKITPLGANLVLMEAEDDEEIPALIKGAKDWLSNWFKEIRPWDSSVVDSERLVWIRILGVPPHAWNEEFFSFISSSCGIFIKLDENSRLMKSFDIARVLLRVKGFNTINDCVSVNINGELFHIRFAEDWFGPMIPSTQSLVSGVDVSDSLTSGAHSEFEEGRDESSNCDPPCSNMDLNVSGDFIPATSEVSASPKEVPYDKGGVDNIVLTEDSINANSVTEVPSYVSHTDPDNSYVASDSLPLHGIGFNFSPQEKIAQANPSIQSGPMGLSLLMSGLPLGPNIPPANESTNYEHSISIGPSPRPILNDSSLQLQSKSVDKNKVRGIPSTNPSPIPGTSLGDGRSLDVSHIPSNSRESVNSLEGEVSDATIVRCNSKFWKNFDGNVAQKIWKLAKLVGVSGLEADAVYEIIQQFESRDSAAIAKRGKTSVVP